MTHTAKNLAVGLTVIALALNATAVVPVAGATWNGEAIRAPHNTISPPSAVRTTPTAENATTREAAAAVESRSIDVGVPFADSIENGEANRYEFTAEAGQIIRVVHNDISNPANVTLYDPNGEVLARDTTRSKYRHPFGAMAEESGTYTLEVRSEQRTTYQLQIDTRNPDYVSTAENTTNDARETALSIDEDDGNLTGVLAQGEEDWYAVHLEQGERLSVTVSHDRSGQQDGSLPFDLGNGMEVEILNAEGRSVGQLDPIASSTGDDWSEYDAATQGVLANATGTYYIRVRNSSYMGGFAEYRLSIEVTESEPKTPP